MVCFAESDIKIPNFNIQITDNIKFSNSNDFKWKTALANLGVILPQPTPPLPQHFSQ